MYDELDRSGIKALRRRGASYSEIARQMGCDRKTVKRILALPTEEKYEREGHSSQVDCFKEQIEKWLKDDTPVERMLELVREEEVPYKGSRSAFFARVKRIREVWEQGRADRFVRFEGLPGEYAQVDWGEVRNFPFLREEGQKRYFLALRLKYSRLSYVQFTTNMVLETLVRGMLRAFESFQGVPWNCVFDNMKTVTVGRDEHKRPIWNPKCFKFMTELDSHPEACWPQSGNQKGAVENLVGWVKSSFMPERKFLDDADLAHQCLEWQTRANGSVSQAHGRIPLEVHRQEEVQRLTPLKTTASDYGLFDLVTAGPESLISIDKNRYSVPVGYVGIALTARLREHFVDFYDGDKQVVRHQRRCSRMYRPIVVPEHFNPVFEKKPRARVMLYRDHLMQQDPSLASYITELCRRYRGAFGAHILQIYTLWRAYGGEQLGVACALASEHEAYGADYLASLLKAPRRVVALQKLNLPEFPSQATVDRNLAAYEAYVERTGYHDGP